MIRSVFVLSIAAALLLAACPGASTGEQPDEKALRERRDHAVIAQLRAAGSDLSQPHRLEHHFVAASKKAVAAAARDAQARGFETTEITQMNDDDIGTSFSFDVISTMHLQDARVSAQTAQMAEIAHKYGISYDGWGTVVVPAAGAAGNDAHRGTMSAGETEDSR